MKFSSLRLTSVKGVREYIMKMQDISAQLKKLEIDMSESFLVHFILNTLPHEYGPFKISYNTHKNKWSINDECKHFAIVHVEKFYVVSMSYFGVIKEIWEVKYVKFNVSVFKCKWIYINISV